MFFINPKFATKALKIVKKGGDYFCIDIFKNSKKTIPLLSK